MSYNKVVQDISGKSPRHFPLWIAGMVWVFGIFFLVPQAILAQGGCGSVCIPLESIDPERTQIDKNHLRFIITTEFGSFNNFREGGTAVTNPGGNEATIFGGTLFIDYGAFERLTVSLMIPFINKTQRTNKMFTLHNALCILEYTQRFSYPE